MEYTRNDLLDLIRDIFKITEIPPMINKQILKCITEYNMNFKEIARCLVYIVEVKKVRLELQYGIASVLTFREDAGKYFHQLELDKQRQQAEAQKAIEIQGDIIKFTIKKSNKKRKIKQLDMTDIQPGDDDEQ